MIWRVSENVNDKKGVSSGTRMPDMLDSAWLAIKTKTPKSEPTLDGNSVEPSQKDVSNLLVTASFSFDEETIPNMQQSQSRDSHQRDG